MWEQPDSVRGEGNNDPGTAWKLIYIGRGGVVRTKVEGIKSSSLTRRASSPVEIEAEGSSPNPTCFVGAAVRRRKKEDIKMTGQQIEILVH